MGANDAGVVIGNEAVWTVVDDESIEEERLLGMDLVRYITLSLWKCIASKIVLSLINFKLYYLQTGTVKPL